MPFVEAGIERMQPRQPGVERQRQVGIVLDYGPARTRLVGRVSMDMIAVDLTPVPDAGFGTPVTMWGRAGNGAVLPIDEVAHSGGTLSYELMCALAPRVPVVTD